MRVTMSTPRPRPAWRTRGRRSRARRVVVCGLAIAGSRARRPTCSSSLMPTAARPPGHRLCTRAWTASLSQCVLLSITPTATAACTPSRPSSFGSGSRWRRWTRRSWRCTSCGAARRATFRPGGGWRIAVGVRPLTSNGSVSSRTCESESSCTCARRLRHCMGMTQSATIQTG